MEHDVEQNADKQIFSSLALGQVLRDCGCCQSAVLSLLFSYRAVVFILAAVASVELHSSAHGQVPGQ
jgi:hypothetical protein